MGLPGDGFTNAGSVRADAVVNKIQCLAAGMSIMEEGWDIETCGNGAGVNIVWGYTPPSRSEGCETPLQSERIFYVDN